MCRQNRAYVGGKLRLQNRGNGGSKDKKDGNVSSDLNCSLLLQSKTLSTASSRVDEQKSTEDGSNKLKPDFPRDLTRLLSPSDELDLKEDINTDEIDEVTATISSITESKSINGSPKANENSSVSGVLIILEIVKMKKSVNT
ncbi:hypothetical protein POM88_038652 [Heracleum sosnowskyi]|uniref:Uncharacterized protein n=1 Tax=Heracleum sosnowskyi TaxID=360622 RepID=A0AAD8M735_9APIA|nr:hypothetical protein POM88_038652 [Heracleum sosnowskyi]